MRRRSSRRGLGFRVGTVRDWEQGRAVPGRPAQILFRVIEAEPEIVRRVFRRVEGGVVECPRGCSRNESWGQGTPPYLAGRSWTRTGPAVPRRPSRALSRGRGGCSRGAGGEGAGDFGLGAEVGGDGGCNERIAALLMSSGGRS